MRFGIFNAPSHPATHNPTLSLENDLELVEWVDHLGYDEAWVGEHHSSGFEMIASPEVFIAAASQRTRNIDLCTGVVSLPYQNPFILADRIVMLDHICRGRFKFGVGPGALASDSNMVGIDHMHMRRMMNESLEAMIHLFTSDEPLSMETDWFTLHDAVLQHRPYSHPCFDVAVAATMSPAGPRAAGKNGVGLLSMAATTSGGFEALATHRDIWKAMTEESGHVYDPGKWTLVGPMYVAETRERAFKDVEYGLYEWADFFTNALSLPMIPQGETDPSKWPEMLVESGSAVIGTPDDAIAQIERLQEQTGGFGCYLIMCNDWANRDNTRRSYELIARHVFPAFQGSTRRLQASHEMLRERREEHLGVIGAAIEASIQSHRQERAAEGKDDGWHMEEGASTPYLEEDVLTRGGADQRRLRKDD